MSKYGDDWKSWATEAEVYAASQSFNMEIFVRRKFGQNWDWYQYSRSLECDHRRGFITILFEQELKHYSLITNTSRPCKCETAESTQVREINQANPRKVNPPKYRGINTQNLTVPGRRKGIMVEETENVLSMRGAKPTKKG